MNTNVEALKNLYVQLGGEAEDVQDCNTIVEVLNVISGKYEGETDADKNPDAIDNIAAVAENIGGGGGDWSIAKVTIDFSAFNPSYSSPYIFPFVDVSDDYGVEYVRARILGNTQTFDVPLYKGKFGWTFEGTYAVSNVSGNATLSLGHITVTGNCGFKIAEA